MISTFIKNLFYFVTLQLLIFPLKKIIEFLVTLKIFTLIKIENLNTNIPIN